MIEKMYDCDINLCIRINTFKREIFRGDIEFLEVIYAVPVKA